MQFALHSEYTSGYTVTNKSVLLTASSWLVTSRRRWRHRAAASLLRSRRRSRLRISSAVISSVRMVLFGPGKRRAVTPCAPLVIWLANCGCHSWLLSSSESKQSLPCVNSFSKALSVESICARVVGVKTKDDGITEPILSCTQHANRLSAP